VKKEAERAVLLRKYPFRVCSVPNTHMRESFGYIILFLVLWSLDLLVNFFNAGRKAFVPSIRLDARIPFIPSFIYFYSLYFPLILFPLIVLFEAPRLLEQYLIASALVMMVSYLTFLVLPTKLMRISIKPTSSSRRLTLLFHRLVAPCNLLPSMHVSLLIVAFSILLVYRTSYAWILSIPIGLSIISVVFTKQHYILDLITAVPLALLAFFLSPSIQAWLR
jgi:hypothetical protein